MRTVGERVLETLFETALDYAIVAMDLDGLVTSWSAGAQVILGWSAQEMMGRPASLIFTPTDRARGVPHAEIEAALAQGTGANERWLMRRDGSQFWAASHVMQLRGVDGQVEGLVKVLRDRTAQHLAEQKQRADARFLREVFAASGDCIQVLDLDGSIQFMNEGGLRALEVADLQRMRGSAWADLWKGSNSVLASAALALARDGGLGRFEGQSDTLAGNTRSWDVQVTPIIGVTGKAERLLVVQRDISGTRAAEMALREVQGLNSLILESSRDCIMVLDLDARTQFISPGGIAAMEIEDLPAVLGLPWLGMWNGAELEAAREAVAEACAGRVGRFQGFCPTQKGLAKWWDTVISPLPGADGRPERLVSVGRDITDAREAQLRLELSEERLQLALGASGMVGIWDVDLLAGTIFGDANFARLHGMDVAEAADGAPVTQVFRNMHGEDAEEVRAQLSELIGGADLLHLEHRLIQGDGSERWIVAHGRLVRDAEGTPIRLPGAVVDVTERHENEQRLRLLMEELAHRSKNTLAVVQSIAAQTMRGDGAMAEARTAFTARLQALSAAHDVLLQNSWIEAGLQSLIDSTARIHATGPDGELRLRTEGIDVTLAPQAALSFAMVLHELATNAVKYGALSTPAGHVEVRWHVDEKEHLHFTWLEQGGPAVLPPQKTGFGSRLIKRSLSSDLQASVDLAYPPEGARLTVVAPLAALREVS